MGDREEGSTASSPVSTGSGEGSFWLACLCFYKRISRASMARGSDINTYTVQWRPLLYVGSTSQGSVGLEQASECQCAVDGVSAVEGYLNGCRQCHGKREKERAKCSLGKVTLIYNAGPFGILTISFFRVFFLFLLFSTPIVLQPHHGDQRANLQCVAAVSDADIEPRHAERRYRQHCASLAEKTDMSTL